MRILKRICLIQYKPSGRGGLEMDLSECWFGWGQHYKSQSQTRVRLDFYTRATFKVFIFVLTSRANVTITLFKFQ